MNKKNIAVLTGIVLIACATLSAWAEPKAVLTKALVEKYLRDYKSLDTDLTNLDDKSLLPTDEEAAASDESVSASFDFARKILERAYDNSSEVRAVLKKYGWGKEFIHVTIAIMAGYTFTTYETMMKDDSGDTAAYKSACDELLGIVHPKDVELIRKYEKEFETMLNF